MKHLLNFAAICAVILTACNPTVEPELNLDGEFIYSCQLPEVENGKTAWVPGDQILIHGEYSADQKIVTLAPADISEDGKTCYVNVEGVTPFEQKAVKSVYYAAYPAEYVSNASQCKESTTYNTTNSILIAGYDKSKTFVLDCISEGFSFTVTGDFDSYDIKGNNDETMGYSSVSTKLTPNAKLYTDKKGAATQTIKGKVVADGTTVNHISFIDQPRFTDGFLLTFYKGETPVKYIYNENYYEIKRAQYISLGDITSSLIDYKSPTANDHKSSIPTAGATDLGAAETANCYIVTKPGVYSFKAVKGNSTTAFTSTIGSVELLWETWGNTETVTPNSVISAVDFEKDQVYFQVAEGYHYGNAVIAVKNDMGAIMWSWHIWLPETEITEDLYNLSRRRSMDRNLGALVAATAEGAVPEAVGLVYQWGRKDPFAGVGDFSSKQAATVAGIERTIENGALSTAQAIKRPTTFASVEGNWNEASSEALWAGSKTMYDPCPPGYRVPYRSEYLPFTNSPADIPGWEYNADKHIFAVGVPQTYYPLSGYLSWDGSYGNVGTGERVWSSRTHDTATKAYNFRISPDGNSVSYGNSGKEKANGYAVRCVVYESTPFENAPGTPVKVSHKSYTVDMKELSGLWLSQDKSFLYGVGDQGEIVKLSFDGKVESVIKRSLDMESITMDPATGDLYLGCEPDVVVKFPAPEYSKYETMFRIAEAKDYGNSGVEGISWYKDNTLLVGTQTGANLWCCQLDGTVLWKRSMRTVAIGQLEIADIHYDPVKDQIWIIDSETQSIYLFNGDATEHLATYKVSFGGNCESVHVDYGNNCVWIADDTEPSKLFKIEMEF